MLTTTPHAHPKLTPYAYDAATQQQGEFLEFLREKILELPVAQRPAHLEVSFGAAELRLGLKIVPNDEASEVMVLMTQETGVGTPRATGVLIMREADALAAVQGRIDRGEFFTPSAAPGSSGGNGQGMADPCVDWAWKDGDWVCIAYGN